MKVIGTGSLGNISKPLIIDLVQKDHQITVINSKTGKQKDIEDLGAKVDIGSLEDVSFLGNNCFYRSVGLWMERYKF